MDLRDQLQQTLAGAYTLERELGGGGMSRVFVADETALGRRVVVKVLPPDLTAGVNIERFKREIQVAARLQHAHIVPVLAAGETNGLPYYTMPFVEGESLRARLVREGALPIGEVVSTLRDVSRALAYAHDRGVVHRDIKPDNVMLSGGSAVVTDFGIAKAISASRTDGETATLTQVGTSIGTPSYMAPEQVAGDPATDHRADLYAFGCMAYELLTGRPPFVEKSPQQVLAAHLARRPDPITALRPDTPPALAAIIDRCLEKDAMLRPDTALEITRALDIATSGGGHAAMPAILMARPGALRRALALWAVAVVAVAVLARAAVIGIGLPEWVFPGAMLVMAMGLPVILFTAYVQRVTRQVLTMTPTHTPGGTATLAPQGTLAGIAMKASPHVSWRRTTLGGALAVGAFVVLVGGFMLLRALGIGPAGSLMAAGRLDVRDPLLVTDFAVTNADSSLGKVLSDATKATLAQSSVITIQPPEAIGAALARMQRPRTSTIDLALAREMATRDGMKAIVDGQVNGLGAAGYIVTVRLVTVDSLRELASFRESASDAQGLIDVIDKLSRQLRGRIGESLREVNATPALARVTTGSFEALRKFTEGDRAEALEANRPKAIALLAEAVAIDSTFAEAWRRLGIVMVNAGLRRSQIDSALTQAFRFRNRASDMERLFIEATYYTRGPARDRARGIAAYEELVRRGDSLRASNNLALALTTRAEFARAESVYRIGIRAGGLLDRPVILNPVRPMVFQQKWAAAESILAKAEARYPDYRSPGRGRVNMLYMRGDSAGFRRAIDSVATHGDSLDKNWARPFRARLAIFGGRPSEGLRVLQENISPSAPVAPRVRFNRARNGVVTWVRTRFLNERNDVLRELDAALVGFRIGSLPEPERPYFGTSGVIVVYARGGRPDRARALLAEYDAEVRDSAQRRDQVNDRHQALGEVLLAEGNPLEAIAEFRQAYRLPDGPSSDCTICLSLDLSRAFDAAAMTDSAIVHYERAVSDYYPDRMIDWVDPLLTPLFLKRLGELHESRNDYVKAAENYRKFIALWANAEPEMRLLVDDARARLRRIADLERPGG
jgi:tetratricopeptide (TPR) repeat protein